MSKTDEFIKEFLYDKETYNDWYDGIIFEVTKDEFENEVKDKKFYHAYFERTYMEYWGDACDVTLHPLKKICVTSDWSRSYDSGAWEFGFEFYFKHKGKYYRFVAEGGN